MLGLACYVFVTSWRLMNQHALWEAYEIHYLPYTSMDGYLVIQLLWYTGAKKQLNA